MHNWRRYILPQTGTKLTKKCSSEFGGLLWCHLTPHKNHNIGAQLQSLACIIASKTFRKIYFLYDFWCAQTCSFRAIFGLPVRSLTIIFLSALYNVMLKKLYECTSTFSALNYCGGIFFNSLSYLYQVVRTTFSADFWTFRNI